MTVAFLEHLRPEIRKNRDDLKASVGTAAGTPGSPITSSKDLAFSGRVFMYTINPPDPMQLGELIRFYRDDGMFLEIRGSDYLFYRSKESLHS